MPTELENALRDLPRIGSLVKDRGYRQVWRFEHQGRAYYLKFYPRRFGRLKRLFRGSPALREFFRLQWLQKAAVPAPRAVAVLSGFVIAEQIGDAVISEAIEPAVQLDQYLNTLQLAGEPIPDHLQLAGEVRSLIMQLGRAKLGHADLHLGNFLLHEKKLYLLDGYAVQRGGLRLNQIMQLAHAVSPWATTTDLQRFWDEVGPGGLMPKRNPISRKWWRKFQSLIHHDNRYFGRLKAGEWGGSFYRLCKYPRRGSAVSRMEVGEADWHSAWPMLLGQMESDQLEVLKRTRSGDVLAGEIILGGRPVEVIVKRPRRKRWYRYVNEIGRGCRARRAWGKAWSLVAREIPTAWPILFMEKRRLGYVIDQLIVFEKVPGPTLAAADLDALPPADRERLFGRIGRLLRRLEERDLYPFDAKSSNWIIRPDEKTGPAPVLIDVDGIRRRRWVAFGIQRLLRSMRDHPQYTPADSLALCRGYAPWSPLVQEKREEQEGEPAA